MKSYLALMIADTHMSNRLPFSKPSENGRTDRLDDQLAMWKHVKKVAKEREVNGVFILGDLFDKSKVDGVTLTETTGAIMQLSKVAPVHILGGNHEGIDPTSGRRFASEMFDNVGSTNVKFLRTALDTMRTPDWLRFWPIEFASVSDTLEYIAKARQWIKRHRKNVEVLLLHNSVIGCRNEGWTCSDGIPQEDARDGFDWTFAGHFHTRQKFGEDNRGLYLSSPLHFRFDDAGRDAGFWLVRFFEDGTTKRKFIHSKLPRFHVVNWPDVKGVKGKKGDYLRVIVEATHASFELMRNEVQRYVESMEAQGAKVSMKHKPVYHHVERVTTKKRGDGSVSLRKMVEAYVEDVNVQTKGLSAKRLKKIGLKVLTEVEGEEQS